MRCRTATAASTSGCSRCSWTRAPHSGWAACPAAPATLPLPPRGHGEHVLYVDDDETMVVLVERLLERSGYRVSGYHDAHQAIAAVRDNPQGFDFVVTDFNMPDCSGLEVAHELA